MWSEHGKSRGLRHKSQDTDSYQWSDITAEKYFAFTNGKFMQDQSTTFGRWYVDKNRR